MNGLRDSIASLRAAAWLRWRLLALRTRRALARESAAPAGSGYYLSPAEIPVEGVDFEPVELSPDLVAQLDATRAELVDVARAAAAGPARPARARRRRTAAVATAAVVSLGVLGAGATALVTGSTGIPAVDRLLGIYERELSKPGAEDRGGPAGRDLRPAADGSTSSVAFPLGDGREVVGAAYVAAGGEICAAVRAETGGRTIGSVPCVAPAALADRVARTGGVVEQAVTVGDHVVLIGFVDERVVELRGQGPSGAVAGRLGERWSPPALAGAAVRPFVAVADRPRDASGRPLDLSADDYDLVAVRDDGGTVDVAR